MTIDYNYNYAQCIKSTANWGSEVFINICNGVTHTIPWGSLDWTGAVFLATFGTLLGLFMVTVPTVAVVSMLND